MVVVVVWVVCSWLLFFNVWKCVCLGNCIGLVLCSWFCMLVLMMFGVSDMMFILGVLSVSVWLRWFSLVLMV